MNNTSKFLALREPEMVLPYLRTLIEGYLDEDFTWVPSTRYHILKVTSAKSPFARYLKDNGHKITLIKRRPIIEFQDLTKDTSFELLKFDAYEQKVALNFIQEKLEELKIHSEVVSYWL